ncbi:UNKNOWN [Stylonychia lemnae]|uniref:TLDc domain-containing protein n=1 Tax=Stylonychia lemnae TaxID=5949 RepID=A0A078AH17_STYLE|nr:UNKNOWN [Stylonychia lemnae]|eukprot:CDW80153.1 UNKNOWN [Stylonychia lemnae]
MKVQNVVKKCEIMIQFRDVFQLNQNDNDISPSTKQIIGRSNEELKQQQEELKVNESEFKKKFRALVDSQVTYNLSQQASLLQLEGHCSLLYKGSKHGFRAQDFHSRCDNKGPTVSFILSNHGQVFGGYTSVPWQTPEKLFQPKKDSTAYLFQLNKNSKHPIYQNFVDHAVGHFKNQILQFGLADIHIEDECNLKNTNQCSIGNTFKPPKNLKYGENEMMDYLAGANKFKVLEIEVYKIEQ